jgi:hypothetical protein
MSMNPALPVFDHPGVRHQGTSTMKPSKLLATLATLTLALGLSFNAASQAQETDKLPNYVPVLPQVKARALAVDPQKGYLVKQVKLDDHVFLPVLQAERYGPAKRFTTFSNCLVAHDRSSVLSSIRWHPRHQL